MPLTEAQREARREHRTRLDWQVTGTGLVSRPPVFGTTPGQKREIFHAWAALLGAVPEPPIEHTYPSRTQVLRAETRVPHPKALTGDVRVVLYAEIDLEEEGE